MKRTLLITGTLALILTLAATPAIAQSAGVGGLQAVSAKVATTDNHTATDAVKGAQTWTQAETARKAAEAEAARVAAEQAAAQQAAQQKAVEEQAAQVAANEEGDAWAILAGYGLSGVSLSFGDTYGYEAISYYKSGHIVINPNHTTSLSTLIAHEVNHIIAWRQSGQTTE